MEHGVADFSPTKEQFSALLTHPELCDAVETVVLSTGATKFGEASVSIQ